MVGVLVLAIAGVVAWKYRDSLGEYVKGNTGPARAIVCGVKAVDAVATWW